MTEKTKVRITELGGVLSVVPLIMGYEPADGDTVMLGLNSNGSVVVGMRFDAETARTIPVGQVDLMLSNVQGAGVFSALVIGYGKDVTPAVDRISNLLGRELIIRDAVRVEGNRYWSFHCDDLDCCPIDGREFQRETEATTALRAEGGLTAESKRDNIAERIAAPAGDRAEAAQTAWTEALASPLSVLDGRAAVNDAIADCQAGKPIDTSKAARLAQAMTQLAVRDHAWALMAPEHAREHTGLWTEVVRNIPAEAVAAPATMLAFTAWQAGEGATANLAIERALAADPDYSMAHLISDAVSAGIPPSAATLPMTAEQVAESYGMPLDPEPERELEAG